MAADFSPRALHLRPADEILKLNLPIELADQLDPSVRDEYRRLWNLAHFEDDGPQEREPQK